MKATASAMPVAADRKFCTARPVIWTRLLMVDLTAIGLPVGVGDEADGRIEGQSLGHGAETLRIERQNTLKSHQAIEKQEAHAR